MTDLLPPWTLLAPFLVAAFALNLTPGADMTYVLARSLAQGREAGLVSALGIAVGSAIHTTAAAIGLSALLLHSEAAFTMRDERVVIRRMEPIAAQIEWHAEGIVIGAGPTANHVLRFDQERAQSELR